MYTKIDNGMQHHDLTIAIFCNCHVLTDRRNWPEISINTIPPTNWIDFKCRCGCFSILADPCLNQNTRGGELNGLKRFKDKIHWAMASNLSFASLLFSHFTFIRVRVTCDHVVDSVHLWSISFAWTETSPLLFCILLLILKTLYWHHHFQQDPLGLGEKSKIKIKTHTLWF